MTKQLTKLTDEVFSMPECPDWAQYAAVDCDGAVVVFDNVPHATVTPHKDTIWVPLVIPCKSQVLHSVTCDPTHCRDSLVHRTEDVTIATAEELYKELRILMSDIDLGSRSYCDSISMYKMEMENINRNIRKCKQLVSKLQQLTEGEKR